MITRNKPFIIGMYALMAFLTIACIFPFLLLIMSSVTSEASLATYGYSLFPKEFSMESYKFLCYRCKCKCNAHNFVCLPAF